MYKKKILAWLLFLIMIINLLPINVFANAQTPSKSTTIAKINVASIKTLSSFSPNVTVQWNGVKNEPKVNQPPDHPTQYYKFIVTDSLGTAPMPSPTFEATGDSTTESTKTYIYNVGEQLKSSTFTNGKLYKIEIVPGHDHTNDGVITKQWANGNEGVGYFITDFNTKMEKSNGQLEINWEYIPGASYRIGYLQADRTTVSEIEQGIKNNSGATIPPTFIPIDRDYAEDSNNQITVNGVKRVKYIIEDAVPGQIYSAYVVPTAVNNSFIGSYSFDKIVKNLEKDSTGPKVAQASTNIALTVFNVDPNNIRLEWNLGSWITTNKKLLKTSIYKIDEGMTAPQLIGTITNNSLPENKDLGYYQYLRPTKNTRFYVEFQIEGLNEPLTTEIVEYIPGQAVEKPLKPQIPKPFSESIDLSDTNININEYKVIGDDIDRQNIKFEDNTFHVKNKDPLGIQLVWNAPTKLDASNKKVIDYNIKYDIYVTKESSLLNNASLVPVAENITFYEDKKENLILTQDKTRVVGFKALLSQYVKADNTLVPLNANSTYFIKIVAKTPYGNSYILSDPTTVSITVDKDGSVFAPPVLAKPPLKLQGTTTNSATLRWRTIWHEIYANDSVLRLAYPDDEKQQAKQWNSTVYTGIAEEPYIRFKPSTGLNEHILITSNKVDDVKREVARVTTDAAYYINHYIDRTVTLGRDSNYEFQVLSYDEVNQKINKYYEDNGVRISIQDWLAKPENIKAEEWERITPKIPEDNKEADNNNWLEYVREGLNPNTRYVLLIRAYKVLDDGTRLNQTYPSYVLATTLSDYQSPEETPKTPDLQLDTKDDTSITVWWMYNSSFDYEIVYGRVEDPEKATAWNFKISNVPGEENYVSNGAKASIKITGLLPETTYNVWIRAKQKVGDKISAWSNPVTAATDALGIPAAPTGLGPAAYQSILELGQDFPPITKDYITVEWVKNPNDIEDTEKPEGLEKNYSYVVEFADNPEFLDAIIVNTSGEAAEGTPDTEKQYEILSKNMIKFTNLISNRPYYVKVKTKLTFKDKDGSREIVKESDYTKWVRILTKKSTDEYDGGENDNIILYPEPITHDYTNNIWTIEIVDTAKIISDIMKKKDYFYTIKAEKYDNRRDAEIRRVKIPKSVIDTLINQRMELKIITAIGIYEIPAKALAIYTSQYDAKDSVQFELKTIVDYKIANILRPYPEKLLKGEQLDIVIRGKSGTTAIKKLDGYLKTKIKLDTTKEYLYKDLFAYTYNVDIGNWQKEKHTIDTLTDTYITYSTAITGIYSVYEKAKTASTYTSTYGMRSLANTYGISALGTVYFQSEVVHRNQFIHLLLGIAQNKSSIDLAAPIYSDTLTRARTTGIYTETSSGGVNEEQAIAGVVKLYELKTGYKIKPSSVAFSHVSSPYREAARKAYAIGLIESMNPKQPVSYATLCDWILQVTE